VQVLDWNNRHRVLDRWSWADLQDFGTDGGVQDPDSLEAFVVKVCLLQCSGQGLFVAV
jgi:hypothetical protein